MSRKPRYKETGMNSFFGQYLYAQIVPQNHFVRALKELFDWEALGEDLINLYVGGGLYGRPPYRPILMFKMLFLSYLYGLSERDTERFVNENIPARFFLDLAVDEKAPDHSTLTVFKDRLLAAGNWQVLSEKYDGLLGQAQSHGLRFGHIQLVDSVHTQADVNNEKDRKRQKKGKPPRDPQARVVHKGKRQVVEADGCKVTREIRYHGYKTHVSVDAKTRVPTSIVPSMGNQADNKAFPQLMAHDLTLHLPTTTYGGDKAYDDTDIFERIEALGMHVGINLRHTRTTKKDAHKGRWIALLATPTHKAATALRYRVEQPFGQAKDKHGFERCRYLGLLKFGLQSFFTLMVIGVKRMVKLLTGISFRELAKGRHKEVFRPVYASLPWA